MESVDRRSVLTGAMAAALALASSRASGAPQHDSNAGHGPAAPAAARDPKIAAAADAALACFAAAERCVAHCVDLLGRGDAALARCLVRSLDTADACAVLARLASRAASGSAELRAFASACAGYCRACAEECREHAKHHAACAECLDACEKCAAACDALAA
ncbi:MAG: Csp1 family four helix bundle copper storage protein [Deltaproteobacteria bacterium]|nr:Csp1 family four helix bundle copper storage protein [Deltaproteobacteria bacterium]